MPAATKVPALLPAQRLQTGRMRECDRIRLSEHRTRARCCGKPLAEGLGSRDTEILNEHLIKSAKRDRLVHLYLPKCPI